MGGLTASLPYLVKISMRSPSSGSGKCSMSDRKACLPPPIPYFVFYLALDLFSILRSSSMASSYAYPPSTQGQNSLRVGCKDSEFYYYLDRSWGKISYQLGWKVKNHGPRMDLVPLSPLVVENNLIDHDSPGRSACPALNESSGNLDCEHLKIKPRVFNTLGPEIARLHREAKSASPSIRASSCEVARHKNSWPPRGVPVKERDSGLDIPIRHILKTPGRSTDIYDLTNIFPDSDLGSMRCRAVTLSIPKRIDFTLRPIKVASYLKPVVSLENQKRMIEVPIKCLANNSAHAAAHDSALAAENLQ
ncbi:hypothetical protein HAX54_012041 [Datura stramonium]|uniref:Uncharacterized protein n=1 Tax=Datura stramonium TaxID=4076 RepID=A0ABS8TK37_DATST|nr:hypothetical protein [Datura stramonium]